MLSTRLVLLLLPALQVLLSLAVLPAFSVSEVFPVFDWALFHHQERNRDSWEIEILSLGGLRLNAPILLQKVPGALDAQAVAERARYEIGNLDGSRLLYDESWKDRRADIDRIIRRAIPKGRFSYRIVHTRCDLLLVYYGQECGPVDVMDERRVDDP